MSHDQPVATLQSHDSHMTNSTIHWLHLRTEALSWAMPKGKQGEWRYHILVDNPSFRPKMKRVSEVSLISPNGPGGDHVRELH